MPEMPEVETIRQDLSKRVCQKQIVSAEVRLARQLRAPKTIAGFESLVIGKTIYKIDRRGKYLLFDLGDVSIVIHLGMTGQLYYAQAIDDIDMTHVRFLFRLDSGEYLVFADIRTFGGIYAVKKERLKEISGLATLGPEPLSGELTATYLLPRLAKRKSPVKAFLLDQKQVGGLGNIYVDEALFVAGVRPMRSCDSLTPKEVEKLIGGIDRVIADGIRDGGTTFRDYRNGEGGKGEHQNHLFVYGRGGLPCTVCGNMIEKCTVGGRGTHYCASCQK